MCSKGVELQQASAIDMTEVEKHMQRLERSWQQIVDLTVDRDEKLQVSYGEVSEGLRFIKIKSQINHIRDQIRCRNRDYSEPRLDQKR